MSETFFDKVRLLDAIIAAGPKTCDYQRDLEQYLSDSALNQYFFRNISDPGWLDLLAKSERFSSVPPPDENKDDGTIGFPPWPQGEYLEKIAQLVPDLVSSLDYS
jgi:hypothetical protein